MQLNNLKNPQKKSKKRVGRGNGSGHGTYSGKGLNSMVDIKSELELRSETINNNINSIKEPVSNE